MQLFVVVLLFLLGEGVVSQFPPKPTGLTFVDSKFRPGSSISFKQSNICETTPNVKSYSGYVHLPASILGTGYNASIFFWYFEAREHPECAPLAIYLAGGPGHSSAIAATTGQGGPCILNNDSNSTRLNPWSWNNKVNILYIDQPAQTGFSYDTLINGTLDQVTGVYTPQTFTSDPPFTPSTIKLYGTFPSQLTSGTANNSVYVAHALYDFAQVWVNEFPKYQTRNKKISLWTNSWGGLYGPAIFAYFDKQNKKIRGQNFPSRGRNCSKDTILEIDTLGLLQGCIDALLEAPHYPQIAFNNTFDFPVISEATYQELLGNAIKPGGCQDQIRQCRALAAEKDHDFLSNNDAVNKNCTDALVNCATKVVGVSNFAGSDRSAWDLAHKAPEFYPYGYPSGFFNQRWVQQELGVPLNFTAYAAAPNEAIFFTTGDGPRGSIDNLNYILANGLKVHLMHGERDYRCNWLGGENVSLSASYPGAPAFRASGYANIITNNTYTGGMIRQSGRFSFSRIFQAGHYPHWSQPETIYQLFSRALSDVDLATGQVSTLWNPFYRTRGPQSSFGTKSVLPPPPKGECNVWQAQYSCTQEQIDALSAGTAVVKDYIVISPAST